MNLAVSHEPQGQHLLSELKGGEVKQMIDDAVLHRSIQLRSAVAESGCIEFTGAINPAGYGTIFNGRWPEHVHRIVYRSKCGPIPENHEIDHLCRNRKCINPLHLEAVTHRENMRRSMTVMGINARKTQCKRGHELAGDNLKVTPSGSRQCRICLRMHARNAKRRRRGVAYLHQ